MDWRTIAYWFIFICSVVIMSILAIRGLMENSMALMFGSLLFAIVAAVNLYIGLIRIKSKRNE